MLARAWYETARVPTMLYLGTRGGIRVTGRENVPRRGGALIVSNHLSFLDVFVLGVGIPRPLSYVARSSLFVPLVGPFIRSIGAFPIEREGASLAGLKETLKRLKGRQLVLIFPEGTRSLDGEVAPLKPGISTLLRARVPFIPAAVAGTFEALPPGSFFPKPHPICVHFGRPISHDELEGLEPETIARLIHAQIVDCQQVARQNMRRLQGSFEPLAPDSRPSLSFPSH